MFEKWKQHIAQMCIQAINGSITIDEFYRLWPEELHESYLAKLIYEDLEDGIQHFPAKIFSGKPDYESWKSSVMYRRILINSESLKTNLSESEVKDVRHSLLSESKLPLADIPARVSRLSEERKKWAD
jgi:hypothetical protein